MPRRSKSLKSGLQTVQSRLQKQAAAAQALKTAEQKARQPNKPKTSKRRSDAAAVKRPSLPNPFKPEDTVLLVGEGNFSFTQALVRCGHNPKLITSTAYDSEDDCYIKYQDAADTVELLRSAGVEVYFEIDATQLGRSGAKGFGRGKRWDRIVWNFPHVGMSIADQDRNVRANQEVILNFLTVAHTVLSKGPIPVAHPSTSKGKARATSDSEDEVDENPRLELAKARGTILLTLHNIPPYTSWDIPRIAKTQASLQLLRSFVFDQEKYSQNGYEHRLTKGGDRPRGKEGQNAAQARTWEFWAVSKRSDY